MLTPKLQMMEDTIKRLIRRSASGPLEKVVAKAHAADLAFILEHLSSHEQKTIFESCPGDEKRAQILAAAPSDLAARIVQLLSPEKALDLLHKIEPDDISDILEHLPEEVAQDLLVRMRGADRSAVEELSRYDSSSAGGIMSPRFFSLSRDITVKEAVERLHDADADVEMAFYVYVVNELDQLLGVVSLRQLVIARPQSRLFDIMTSDVISVTPDVDQEDVARLASRYGLLAVPVVDEANKLLGIVTIDDVIDVLHEEATEDILRMAGAGAEIQEQRTVLSSVSKRLPWLIVTGIGGALAALLLATYIHLLRSFEPLVFFIPVVLTLADVVGTQSAAFIVRSIDLGRLMMAGLGTELLRQSAVGFLLGLVSGILMGGLSFLHLAYYSSLPIQSAVIGAAVLGSGILASMTAASTLGGLLPVLFNRIRVDPALATGPFVAVVADLLALLIYLGIADLFF